MLLINCTWAEVSPFIKFVRANADREKNALGFLPAGVYEEAAQRGKLFVAAEGGQYAGHLLFGGTFPHARVFQLYVTEEFRRRGVATLLLRRLEAELEALGFLSISAQVANDLPANKFWEQASFSILRTKDGGASRGRTINVRVKDLDTPSLFSNDRSKTGQEISIASRYGTPTPVYVLDLNVFWDVIRHRPRSEYARQVIGAGLDNFIRVVVTSEFVNELKRTVKTAESDPALEFALQLPSLPMPPDHVAMPIATQLAEMVFPSKARLGNLSVRDHSDLMHLVTAIHHHATGFLTSEEAIVQRCDEIYRSFGLEVFHVKDFAAALQSRRKQIVTIQARVSGETLRMWDLVGADSSLVDSFLDAVGADLSFREQLAVDQISNPHVKRVAITSENDFVCLALWDSRAGLQRHCNVKLLADEDHAAAETALECLLSRLTADISLVSPVLIELTLPSGSALIRRAALLNGFRNAKSGPPTQLGKVCIGRAVTLDNVTRLSLAVEQCSGISLPTTLPEFSSHYQLMMFKDAEGGNRHVELRELERLLSPVLFALPGRPGVIVPIQRIYANELFGASTQMSLLPGKEAVLFSERVYLSAPRNVHIMAEGSILFFYESGRNDGRAAIIAVARALGSSVVSKQSIPSTLLRRGVIDGAELEEITTNENVTATRFDTVLLFTRPVPLSSLREHGCVDGANLVTARRIKDEHVRAIIAEAYKRE